MYFNKKHIKEVLKKYITEDSNIFTEKDEDVAEPTMTPAAVTPTAAKPEPTKLQNKTKEDPTKATDIKQLKKEDDKKIKIGKSTLEIIKKMPGIESEKAFKLDRDCLLTIVGKKGEPVQMKLYGGSAIKKAQELAGTNPSLNNSIVGSTANILFKSTIRMVKVLNAVDGPRDIVLEKDGIDEINGRTTPTFHKVDDAKAKDPKQRFFQYKQKEYSESRILKEDILEYLNKRLDAAKTKEEITAIWQEYIGELPNTQDLNVEVTGDELEVKAEDPKDEKAVKEADEARGEL